MNARSTVCRPTALLLVLVSIWLFAWGVSANTEIVTFIPDPIHLYGEVTALTNIKASLKPVVLQAPFTSIELESIATLESTHSAQEKVNWYCLKDIDPGSSYEVRISYAATFPSDFRISLFYAKDILAMHNITALKNDNIGAGPQILQRAMYAKVEASYAGVSNRPRMEDIKVPYNIVLEKHVLRLPIQALKLIIVIVAVSIASIFIVAPKVIATIDEVLAEEKKATAKQL